MARKLALWKSIDEAAKVSCLLGKGNIREELWVDSSGTVARYNLAFINHVMYQRDNGRVLGYDTAHGYHHRHYFGEVENIEFPGYDELVYRFLIEVGALRRKGKL